MNRKKLISTLIVLSCILSFSFMVYLFKLEAKPKDLPVIGQVANFTLFDSNSDEFTLNHLKGKVWLANFIFTTCSDICPIMSKNIASLHRSYVLENGVEMVSISVNPEYDTPEVMASYAEKFNAKTGKWHFLTGPREQIKKLSLNSFKIGSIDEPIFHSAYFALVDRYANIRGYYDGTKKEDIEVLFKDIAQLLREK